MGDTRNTQSVPTPTINTLTINTATDGLTEEVPVIVNGVHVADLAVTSHTENGLPGFSLAVTGYVVAMDDNATNTCRIETATENRPGWIETEPARMPGWMTEGLPTTGPFAMDW